VYPPRKRTRSGSLAIKQLVAMVGSSDRLYKYITELCEVGGSGLLLGVRASCCGAQVLRGHSGCASRSVRRC
jgi:hypothetical protein